MWWWVAGSLVVGGLLVWGIKRGVEKYGDFYR
jgi:hypothetical protein